MSNTWNREKDFSEMYQAASKKDIEALEKVVLELAESPHVNQAIDEIPEAWGEYVPKKRRNTWIMWIVGGVLALVWLGCGFLGGRFTAPAPHETLDDTVESTVIEDAPDATVTPTPTSSPAPTETPTSTATPTETPPPTAFPDSVYLVPDVAAVYPVMPVRAEAAWLLDDTIASFAPSREDAGWQPGQLDEGGESSFVYLAERDANTPALVIWTLDQPLPQDGLYGVFVVDTRFNSSREQQYQVLLEGQPINPVIGNSLAVLNVSDQTDIIRGQKVDEWLSIGYYQIQAGQKLEIKAEVTALGPDEYFAADQILIVKMTEQERELLMDRALLKDPINPLWMGLVDDQALKYEQYGYWTVETKDEDGNVIKTEDKEGFFENPKKWTPITNTLAWNGEGHVHIPEEMLERRIWWRVPGRVPEGTYELYVFVPEIHANATAAFEFWAAGAKLDGEGVDNGLLVQSNHPGEWVAVGRWTLNELATVQIQMHFKDHKDVEVAVDAIALVRIGEP